MKWKTKITEMLGCKYPIILGAFARHDDTELAAAVSKAGGFGILTASYFQSKDDFRNAILKIKKITDNPFGVNFTAPGKIELTHPFYRYLEILNEEGVNTIITAAGKIEAFGKESREYGMNWIHKVTTMKHALSGVEMGADAIILTGLEGGGLKNPKQNTLLINMVNANRLLNIPFIASGGISDGKGFLAALILGAQAVHLCTAFLATKESPIDDNWKQNIVDADSFDTELIQSVCHFESDRPKMSPISMAAGMIDKIISAEDLIKNIINEAEEILKKIGFQGEEINFNG
ncbi:MAG: NAD(P)H-dependent flavin oxidoreductase [Candidatus Hodarchaeota archaeon]